MKISQVKLRNFRTYQEEICISISSLTTFIGKNDVGKSTVLEALDIFFNEGKGVIKLDKEDVNKSSSNQDIEITIVFENTPQKIIIDSTNNTTLKDEYLLNQDNSLEVIKRYPSAGKEKVFIKARHPTNPHCSDLLVKKQNELQKIITDNSISCHDKTINANMRKAIWEHYSNDLQLEIVEIDAAKEDAKNIWGQLKKYMPLYSLFQSDRKNSDSDSEIQDPMKLAVQEIIKSEELKSTLDKIAQEISDKLYETANNTLKKLKEMNPEIANSLNPVIPETENLKWADVFKNVTISGDQGIPINKRGSGVKRLVLLNFFRAEADRRKVEKNVPDIIYAIEEPETSQHQDHQRKLIEAFIELSNQEHTQVVLTTHSPSIVKMLNFDNLRLIKNSPQLEIVHVEESTLPFPSLNEANFLAFSESDENYHNELYGYIESEKKLDKFKQNKTTREYQRQGKNGEITLEQKILSEYIRHQIHHPENRNNTKYTDEELQQSLQMMREFIQKERR